VGEDDEFTAEEKLRKLEAELAYQHELNALNASNALFMRKGWRELTEKTAKLVGVLRRVLGKRIPLTEEGAYYVPHALEAELQAALEDLRRI
jgi:hypothetical protein